MAVSMKVELAQGQLTTGGGLGGLGGGGKLAASRGLTSNGGGGGKAGHVCWTSHVQVLKPPLSSSTFWDVWLLDGQQSAVSVLCIWPGRYCEPGTRHESCAAFKQHEYRHD